MTSEMTLLTPFQLTPLRLFHTLVSLVLLLMIPTVTEMLTRVPPSAPWVASPEAPIFPPLYCVLLVLFLVGVSFQVRRLRTRVVP